MEGVEADCWRDSVAAANGQDEFERDVNWSDRTVYVVFEPPPRIPIGINLIFDDKSYTTLCPRETGEITPQSHPPPQPSPPSEPPPSSPPPPPPSTPIEVTPFRTSTTYSTLTAGPAVCKNHQSK